ncbi:DUF4197 domain-containing protein [Coraliomargarita parva]|uniref:DUF4197 domain-containing protein n=1 Tax=Coraliomargarita parva TaxID=3014050 RepID=UPI0022B3E322|nr:DUF4197 domain-containing protein [Coraliomargarita parva]
MRYLSITVLSLLPLAVVHADFSSWKDKALSVFREAEPELTGTAFSSAEDLAKALREALAVSAERALTELSQAGGFADSDAYRIPLPKSVESLRKPLSLVKREDLLDNFQATLNRAAEKGVESSPVVVKHAIETLTLEDLNELWKGEDDAITRFLEKKSRDELAIQMLPLISEATEASGATRSYKALQSALPEEGDGSFLGKVSTWTGIGAKDFDLDDYVNEKALDALFAAMAAEEKAIREDPAAQTTKLLKQLFGK